MAWKLPISVDSNDLFGFNPFPSLLAEHSQLGKKDRATALAGKDPLPLLLLLALLLKLIHSIPQFVSIQEEETTEY